VGGTCGMHCGGEGRGINGVLVGRPEDVGGRIT
jgi:hypothetical protein